jgi:hypothetical protein
MNTDIGKLRSPVVSGETRTNKREHRGVRAVKKSQKSQEEPEGSVEAKMNTDVGKIST